MPTSIQIINALAEGATVVTANQRAARYVRQQWDQSHHRAGDTAWPAAKVQTWDDWCRAQWVDLLAYDHDDRLLLTKMQEHELWRNIINTNQPRHPNLQVAVTIQGADSLALHAGDANDLLNAYCADSEFQRHWGNSSVETFRKWRDVFISECAKQRLLPASSLESVLTDSYKTRQIVPPLVPIYLLGFDRFTPAQSRLLASMKNAGIDYLIAKPEMTTPNKVAWNSHASPRDELHAAALWARDQLNENQHKRIAIILLDADTRRAEAERIFRRVLAPTRLKISRLNHSSPFEFSLGTIISRHPMTSAALSLLRWCISPLPFEEAASLLRSVWLPASGQYQQHSVQFEIERLRKSKFLLPQISLDDFLQTTQHHKEIPHANQLDSFRRHLGPPRGALQNHSQWASIIQKALYELGWPGTRPLDSAEYQLLERWTELFDDFVRLDFSNMNITLQEAIAKLQFISGNSLFAPESHNAPVQFLGVLEAAGSQFDAIWFTGATADSWPPSGETNPLLPWQLQHDLKMPHANPDADYKLALTMQQRIQSSAEEIVFSHYRENSDGEHLASPLLIQSGLNENIYNSDQLPPLLPLYSSMLEEVDAVGILQPPSETVLKGGANLIKAQSLCPFRAFAEYRLNAAALEPVEFGIDARDSGNVMHHVLQQFWNDVQTQTALRELTEEQRASKLRHFASRELQRLIKPKSALENSALNVQLESIVQLLLQWLLVEDARPAFSVTSTELTIDETQIGPLQIQLRVDRIDTVSNGEVLIDYKTGTCKPSDWDCPRPNEPQLPLYAIARGPNTVQAIAFARVRPGELALTGLQNDHHILNYPKLKKDGTPKSDKKVVDMQQKTSEWHTELLRLANDFHHGTPLVDPKIKYKTCEHCKQELLCRVSKISASIDENEDGLNEQDAEVTGDE